MNGNLFVFIGGSDAQNGDYSQVHRLSKIGGTARWSSLKTARPGDRVLIYIQRPHSAIIAKAKVLALPVKGKPGDYAYRAKIGEFELLPNQLTIRDLRREFPRWDWLRYPRRGSAVPKPVESRLWALAHQKQPRVQILISNVVYGFPLLETMCASGKSSYWSAPRLTKLGDTVLFYVEGPVSAIVATGTALSGTRATKSKWYEAKIGDVRKLESPVTLAEIREMFPEWAWLRSMNMFAYVSPERAKALLERCRKRTKVISNNGKKAGDNHRNGGGFGEAERNRLVERAAIAKVTRLLRGRGFDVTSREKECIGYDLDACKRGVEMHVEVKGVSGAGLQFPITAAEVKQSERDANFRLMVVTSARMRDARVDEFNGDQVKRQFQLNPLTYMAIKR